MSQSTGLYIHTLVGPYSTMYQSRICRVTRVEDSRIYYSIKIIFVDRVHRLPAEIATESVSRVFRGGTPSLGTKYLLYINCV